MAVGLARLVFFFPLAECSSILPVMVFSPAVEVGCGGLQRIG